MDGLFRADVINLQIEMSQRLLEQYASGNLPRLLAAQSLMRRLGLGLADARVILDEVAAHGIPKEAN
jgi:hypothetical protein